MTDKPMQDVMGPLGKLKKRLGADTHVPEVGVDMPQFLVSPNDDADGPHHVRAIFVICEGAGEGQQPVEIPKELEEQLRNAPVASSEERADAARKDLQKLREELKDPRKGIGLDD
jgi:hypothetical protein